MVRWLLDTLCLLRAGWRPIRFFDPWFPGPLWQSPEDIGTPGEGFGWCRYDALRKYHEK
jgi:hypothetical protein